MGHRRFAILFLAVPLAVFCLPTFSRALPAFARKYKTSCQTCHTVYPRLNAFGVAFRVNGFQWPGPPASDAEQTKEAPVELGVPAYKRVFPSAVWPGAIPGEPPVSFHTRSGLTWSDPADGAVTGFVPPSLELLLAGVLGEEVSFFVGGDIFEEGSIEGAGLERAYLQFDNLTFGRLPPRLLDLRFGLFVPELNSYSLDRAEITLTPSVFDTWSPLDGEDLSPEDGGDATKTGTMPVAPVGSVAGGPLPADSLGGPGFTLGQSQLGIQISGLAGGRFRYLAAWVNGSPGQDANGARDVFGRVAWKWGGMAWDGTGISTGPWGTERSAALGIFAYRGSAPNDADTGPDNLAIRRIGADLALSLDRLGLYGGYAWGRDDLLAGESVREVDLDLWFVEADGTVYPWLLGIVRYEEARRAGLDPARRIVPNLTALVRANIKGQLETRLDPDNLKLDTVLLGIDFAF